LTLTTGQSYNQSGGDLTISTLAVGTGASFTQTAGMLFFSTFNETGGTVSLHGLNLTSSTFNLSGGSLTTPSITRTGSGPSNLIWTGGSLTDVAQYFDVTTTTDPTFFGFVYNSSLTLNNGMSLNESDGNAVLLFGSGSTITQNTGSSVNTTFLFMGSTGTGATAVQYNLTGGTLTVGTNALIGDNLYSGPNAATFT
jgi:hypothetical protein